MAEKSDVADRGSAPSPSVGGGDQKRSAFTRGPWRLGAEKFGYIEVLHDKTGVGEPHAVVARVTSRMTWHAQQVGNARLISAAPDLLAALKELHAAYDNYDGGSISEKRIQAACDAAERAISKATA